MDSGLICVSVAAVDASTAATSVQSVIELVDVVEIRLDAMPVPQVKDCYELISKPLLFTNRPNWEGGEYQGPEDERIGPLFEAINMRASYVDFELNGDLRYRNRLLDAMSVTESKMIISSHDFTCTPSKERLSDILKEQIESGAHIGKIVTVAHSPFDVLRVLNLLEEAAEQNFPLCAFCMGEVGKISRLTTLFFGGFMTYGAMNEAQATAPGQLSVEKIHDLLETCQSKLSY